MLHIAAGAAFTHWVPPAGLRYPELGLDIPVSLAHTLAMMPIYAAQKAGLLPDCDALMWLIWELWIEMATKFRGLTSSR